jgi:hypothetical protein
MDRALEKYYNELIVAAIIIIAFCGLGIVLLSRLSNSYVSDVKAMAGEIRQMNAVVKGSVYESGEAIAVFGTCVDNYGMPVINSTATFSAWYPNGTQFIFSDNMTNISAGYFLYAGIMSLVQGTYLTEMVCNATIDGSPQFAKAWGEWQNPFWVNRLANISGQLSNLSLQIGEGFNATVANITFLQQNMTNSFNNTNNLILQTQVIANASVDRNSSLLAYLLYQLLNISSSYIVPANITWTEDADRVVYHTYWSIKVHVYDIYDKSLFYPDVQCTINTTMHDLQYMEPQGNHFISTLYISRDDPDFSWTTRCFWT